MIAITFATAGRVRQASALADREAGRLKSSQSFPRGERRNFQIGFLEEIARDNQI